MDSDTDFPETPLKAETFRSGHFTFQVGLDFQLIQPLLDRVSDAHERFRKVPILPDLASRLERESVVSSVFGTNTIEGGTLTEEQTQTIIESGSDPKDEKELRVTNIKKAYEFAESLASNPQKDSTVSDVDGNGSPVPILESSAMKLHALITDGLAHPHNSPGIYRDNAKHQLTRVGDDEHGGVYVPPKCREDIEQLMKAFEGWINSEPVLSLPPLLRAPLVHYYFERIHPFWDGNGRVGRMLESLVLKSAGFKYAHYALSRYYLEHIDEYFTAFNVARRAENRGEPYPNTAFVKLFLKGMLHVLNRLHDRVNEITRVLLYQSTLKNLQDTRKINSRQYTIINNLLPWTQPHSLDDLQRETWYLGLYRGLTPRTRSRDLQKLEDLGLIRVDDKKTLWIGLP
jgi:Fic family protein